MSGQEPTLEGSSRKVLHSGRLLSYPQTLDSFGKTYQGAKNASLLQTFVSSGRKKFYKLGPKVVSPLMTSEAIELLVNCLTSKESELWHSLGEAWYVSRQEWKGYVPPYRPVFLDGW